MVDYYSLQMFSLHAYSDSRNLPHGSKQIKPTEFNHHTGFMGKVYRAESGELVIAFRGTEREDKRGRGLLNDLNLACKILPAQLQNAFTITVRTSCDNPSALTFCAVPSPSSESMKIGNVAPYALAIFTA